MPTMLAREFLGVNLCFLAELGFPTSLCFREDQVMMSQESRGCVT